MLLSSIEIFAALGAAALCFCTDGFSGLSWLWQLPVFFVGLIFGSILLLGLFLVLWCGTIDLKRPVEKERKFDRILIEQYCDCLIRLCHIKLHTSGMEKLPKDGRFLLVCNHIHLIDPGFLLWCFRGRQLAFIAKRETNEMPIINKALHTIQCQRINRENDREALVTILKCIDLIKQDKASVAVFPEGYTSMDGVLHEFRNGVFKIAQRAKVPIVVCTLRGSSLVFHNMARFRRPHVYMDLVAVVEPEELTGTTKDIGDRIHKMMAEALGDSIG